MTAPTLQPGEKAKLFPGVSFGDYCRIEAVNASTFLTMADQTPKEAYYKITHPKDDTDSLVKGHAAHAAILEPEVFAAQYVACPNFGDYRSPKNREARDNWIQENSSKIVIDAEQFQLAQDMRDAVLGQADTKDLLTNAKGQNELTILFWDAPTGLLCKVRIDRMTQFDGRVLLDVKTAKSTTDRGIQTAIVDYHYHGRMAWYMDALNLVHQFNDWRVMFLWIKNSPPHVFRISELQEWDLAEGRAMYRECLDAYANCKKTGNWPGHPAGITPISLPRWAFTRTPPPPLEMLK